MHAFHLENFSITYDSHLALQGDHVKMPLGCIGAIVGPNGAGKSSLLKALASLIPLTTGKGSVLNIPLPFTQRTHKLKLAYLPQKHHFDTHFPLDVFSIVLMGAYGRLGWIKRPGPTERQNALNALAALHITHLKDKAIGELSGGEQQRVFLARALVQNSDLYLLDEPLNGIDAESTQTLIATWQKLKKAGKTLLVIHHDLTTLTKYFDHVIVINKHILASAPLTPHPPKSIQKALQQAYSRYHW